MTTHLAEIYTIADQLEAEGAEPSVRAVAKVLGIQNTGLIGAGLNEWKARKAALVEAINMPDAFREELELFGNKLLRAAREEGELQARVLSDEIRRLHQTGADREAELLSQAGAREDEVAAEMDDRERVWKAERAALIADVERRENRERALTERVAALEPDLEKAEARAAIADAARSKAEDSRDAAEARFAALSQTTRTQIEGLESEKADWQERAIVAEKKEAVSERLLKEAHKRIDQDAKRIDGLVADVVALATKKLPEKGAARAQSLQA